MAKRLKLSDALEVLGKLYGKPRSAEHPDAPLLDHLLVAQWAQGRHGFESSLGACAGPAARPLPGGQRQWSSSAEPGSASSPGGQGEGSTAPAGQ